MRQVKGNVGEAGSSKGVKQVGQAPEAPTPPARRNIQGGRKQQQRQLLEAKERRPLEERAGRETSSLSAKL